MSGSWQTKRYSYSNARYCRGAFLDLAAKVATLRQIMGIVPQTAVLKGPST